MLDRPTIWEAVFPSLLDLAPDRGADPDAVGMARIVVDAPGIVAGLPVAKEVFGRLGVRMRAAAEEGAEVSPGQAVAEVGGALAAIRGAAPVALTWLRRLSAVATGASPPAEGVPLDAYAARLSRPDMVREAGPSFEVEFMD
jgi:nicotinate-nucleotide pyrophosphorylase